MQRRQPNPCRRSGPVLEESSTLVTTSEQPEPLEALAAAGDIGASHSREAQTARNHPREAQAARSPDVILRRVSRVDPQRATRAGGGASRCWGHRGGESKVTSRHVTSLVPNSAQVAISLYFAFSVALRYRGYWLCASTSSPRVRTEDTPALNIATTAARDRQNRLVTS
ncbi:hypothetical protein B0H11DRAFT_1935852 [Mycena galericulata]|nr:hypothetical protein B0H11DRAFT_1935852 [Mycena galericulata]